MWLTSQCQPGEGRDLFHCERCSSSFNATVAASGRSCPRCRLRDGLDVPLHFRLFERSALQAAVLAPRRAVGAPKADLAEGGTELEKPSA